MSIEIKTLSSEDAPLWDAYVHAHPQATLYHLSGWRNVINKTYGHNTHYLFATINNSSGVARRAKTDQKTTIENPIAGILPLVHLKHFIFGNSLISIPFFDLGGILANNEEVEEALLSEATKLANDLNVDNMELRHTRPMSLLCSKETSADTDSSELTADSLQLRASSCPSLPAIRWSSQVHTHKARMLLRLPESSGALMKSLGSKLRSQIRRPLKEGLEAKIGGIELLDDFYEVFLVNMRDLGSPVHSKYLFLNVLGGFPETARIVIIYKQNQAVACSVIVGFKDTLENPWASALREYSRLSPNMLLYWTMLEYACDNGFAFFDFGRSSPGEGTYKFKEQWGATPAPLHWYYFSSNDQLPDENESEKSRFDKGIHYWKKLPVPVTRIIGPMIRKHIGL